MKTRRKRRRKRIDKPAITSAEIIVMELLRRGNSHKMISTMRNRSQKTIATQIKSAQHKLHAANAPEAVNNYLFRKYGLIEFTND